MGDAWKAMHETFYKIWLRFSGKILRKKYADEELPVRSELFSVEQMEQHGAILANMHQLTTEVPKNQLLKRLSDNQSVLRKVHNMETEVAKTGRGVTPAGEWLLDNFYLIEEQILLSRLHLPKEYSIDLPRLANGPSAGLPRVYDIALEIISHGDGEIGLESLRRFVYAYQMASSLKLGELWAIPIMLRLALIENLRRIATRIAADKLNRDTAEFWANKMIETTARDPKNLILVIADMARSEPPLESSFIAEMKRRLQGQGPALTLPLSLIEQHLSESGLSTEQMIHSENRKQAADQITISNCIASLQLIGRTDWREFVENISIVEGILKEDPAGIYKKMDFVTRNRYRLIVEKVARSSPYSETEVATMAIQLAQQGMAEEAGGRTGHVGYYLVDKGLPQLEEMVDMGISVSEYLKKTSMDCPLRLFLGVSVFITVMAATGLTIKAYAYGVSIWTLPLFGLLSLIGGSYLGVSVTNWLATQLVAAHPLPRMDFSKGIPRDYRTLLVVPTMLFSPQNIENLINDMEVRFLSNRDDHLHFALLTDFRDAAKASLLEDEPLLELAQKRIQELNVKHRTRDGDIFFLFHRPRVWNPVEKKWMGYERKRGKLEDLNGFLIGQYKDSFSLIVGDTEILSDIKYVITLDTDTIIGRDSARQFVGSMAHPLNRPLYDEKSGCITEGYGILQPIVTETLSRRNRSWYQRMCQSELGIDPYTRATSNVYQDLFGEGSFVGKGIYDIDAFERTLGGRFPENRILSHDLIEGCYARSGLLSDLEMYEEYPLSYIDDVKRRHRWIRGDWQIARWILPNVPDVDGQLQKNPLSMLSRWKIFDNLRRSLTAPALTVLFLWGWTLSSSAWFWSLALSSIIFVPPLLGLVMSAIKKPPGVDLEIHLFATAGSAVRYFAQAVFSLVCLPYEAFYSLDAIVRVEWRLFVSNKDLLQWNLDDPSGRMKRISLAGSFRTMWINPFIVAAFVITAVVYGSSGPLSAAGPLLVLWFFSPLITWWLSRPIIRRGEKLTADQSLFLRKIFLKTWSFFETFHGAADNWLPPDNYQEYPVKKIAHRTSPTNIGLALLANLSACDFGVISAGKLMERTAMTFQTMGKMERYRGHFYNWYDTQTLEPMPPLYISSVDSGNLAGHLMILQSGLEALPDQKIFSTGLFESLSDTVRIISDAAEAEIDSGTPAQIDQLLKDLDSMVLSFPRTLQDLKNSMERLAKQASELVAGAEINELFSSSQYIWWIGAFSSQCQDILDELKILAPWTNSVSEYQDNPDSFQDLDGIPTLKELASFDEKFLPTITGRIRSASTMAEKKGLTERHELISSASQKAKERISAIQELAMECKAFSSMEYDFLYDEKQHLLAIGYNADEGRKDSSSYDLLASEARLAVFVAIAQRKLAQESWFSLGRLLTISGRDPVLLSWSGSMFEYLMPLLVMPNYESTLLDQTYKVSVARQIEYGKRHKVPWGISESGYNAIDAHRNYQYRSFGVPGLGLKRGLAADLVISPYSSALALMVSPDKACANLEHLAAEGFESRYGFYEAIDYTKSRLLYEEKYTVVRSFMSHHQGMTLLSLVHVLLDRPMQKRFKSNPMFQAAMLLLQERIPKVTPLYKHITVSSDHTETVDTADTPMRIYSSPDTPVPEVQLLSNGNYHVMVTNNGGGYSRWKDLAVTRWREDRTCDNWGTFCYIRDISSRDYWSSGYQPALKQGKNFRAIFSEGRAEFRRRDNNFDTYTEIAVSPEDDIEMRRIKITNHAKRRRTIDITSYAEVVIAPHASDAAHPAFSNLFVQTEIMPSQHAILCTRRPRSEGEQVPWMVHLMAIRGIEDGKVSYETDRLNFTGRGNTVANPRAITGEGGFFAEDLSGNQGSVLDPIVAIRCQVSLDPQESATVNIVTGMFETRHTAMEMLEKYQDRNIADRVFDLARTHGQVMLRQLNISETEAQLYGRLASSIIYANDSLRADPGVLLKNRKGQSGLWGYAISGDLPIVLLEIEDIANFELVRQMVQAHAYWRIKGMSVDLVILNKDSGGYRQLLQDRIMGLITTGFEANILDRPGGIFVRTVDRIAEEDRILIRTVSRIIISDKKGTLADQVGGRMPLVMAMPLLDRKPIPQAEPLPLPVRSFTRPDLAYFNGLGGFTQDGKEYVITTAHRHMTPAPWVNVLANPNFGSVISESGMAYTWSENAHEFRLTPWENDPVSDSRGEAFYLRDDENGYFWSPMSLPCPGSAPYVTRHGFGYSVFEHTERSIYSEVWEYVAMDEAIKFIVLKVRNDSGRARRLSATGYVEWVLGDLRAKSSMYLITEIDPDSGALLVYNPYNKEFENRTAFFDVDDRSRTVTADRTEFIGRNGTLDDPAAMRRTGLSGRSGSALDPCGAIQVSFALEPGEEREIVFRLGVGRDPEDARRLINDFQGPTSARRVLEGVWRHWDHTLSAIRVETPEPSLNILANGWLVYQVLVCRMWGRSATYQPGGAFGFRDQLQDTMSLIYSSPHIVREHLLLCASRQFMEGDVQHWWHPPAGRGVRTRCSDDYLWLPLVTCRYVLATGDTGVLDEPAHFLLGRMVREDEESYYDLPERSEEMENLYEHCVRAILYGLKFGEHGLPLIGTGDWNDGMNMVGEKGKGESIWLGFFLYKVLTDFAEIARLRADDPFAERCINEAWQLRSNIEKHGWDGGWYLRAYFDDGTPLGSSENPECQIDSIAQSWSVLSEAGDQERSKKALDAVDERLVRREERLIQLFDPPFDKSELNPGYIKGYVPGVRENGGQYTHAAIWATMAFAKLGDNRRAWELLGLINPVNHGSSSEEISIYKVEPYVVAADVYAVPPHTGRGGWTWYTGSAGWMYQLIMEAILGLKLERDKLYLTPCLPADWKMFNMRYRYRETFYNIAVQQAPNVKEEITVSVDGVRQKDRTIPLVDDHKEHRVKVSIPVAGS